MHYGFCGINNPTSQHLIRRKLKTFFLCDFGNSFLSSPQLNKSKILLKSIIFLQSRNSKRIGKFNFGNVPMNSSFSQYSLNSFSFCLFNFHLMYLKTFLRSKKLNFLHFYLNSILSAELNYGFTASLYCEQFLLLLFVLLWFFP